MNLIWLPNLSLSHIVYLYCRNQKTKSVCKFFLTVKTINISIDSFIHCFSFFFRFSKNWNFNLTNKQSSKSQWWHICSTETERQRIKRFFLLLIFEAKVVHHCCNITLPPSLCFPYGVFCLYVSLFLSSNEKKWDQISLSRWPDRLNQWTEKKKKKKKKANPRSQIKFTSKPYRMTRIQQQHTHTPRYDGTSITNVHNECPIIDDQKKKKIWWWWCLVLCGIRTSNWSFFSLSFLFHFGWHMIFNPKENDWPKNCQFDQKKTTFDPITYFFDHFVFCCCLKIWFHVFFSLKVKNF